MLGFYERSITRIRNDDVFWQSTNNSLIFEGPCGSKGYEGAERQGRRERDQLVTLTFSLRRLWPIRGGSGGRFGAGLEGQSSAFPVIEKAEPS